MQNPVIPPIGNPVQPVQQGNNPVVYATSPYATNAVVNYATKEGAKLFTSAIEGIEPRYSGEPTELAVFLERLAIKGDTFGWNNTIFAFNVGTAAIPVNKNLTTEHGQITLEQCREKAVVFFNTPNVNVETQASILFYKCLVQSLTPEFFKKLNLKSESYTVGTRGGARERYGATMLKVMISLVIVNTTSTVSIIRLKLQNLPAKMKELKSDIEIFNEFVKTQMIALATRGEPTADLLVSLFAGYAVVQDETFKRYVEDIEIQYEAGNRGDLTADELMDMAESRYKTMVEKGKWNVPSETQKRLVVLQAAIDKERAENAQALDREPARPPRAARAPRTKAAYYTGVNKWKAVAPKAGEAHTKKVKGKEYIYCPNHTEVKWVLKAGHANGCSLAPAEKETKKKRGSPDTTTERSYAAALAHVHDEEYEDESEGDDENA